jgi:hypothetical protein
MSKTEYGCQILEDKGHFIEFAQYIRQHADENEDPELIMKLKSILWAVVSSLSYCALTSFFTLLRVMLEQPRVACLS